MKQQTMTPEEFREYMQCRDDDWRKLPKNKSIFPRDHLGEIVGKEPEPDPIEQMERFLKSQGLEEKSRKKPSHAESQLQQRCVLWFRTQYPAIAPLLVAVPNAARRNVRTGAIMKREGLTAGVADLILLLGRGEYHSLCIEMKTTQAGSKQSKSQIAWEEVAERYGNKYVVCRTLEEFQITVNNYLFP